MLHMYMVLKFLKEYYFSDNNYYQIDHFRDNMLRLVVL